MSIARGIEMVKATNKPHIMYFRGAYKTFSIGLTRYNKYAPRDLSKLFAEMDARAYNYCRRVNAKRAQATIDS